MNSSHYQHLLQLYDCRTLLHWLENEDDEKQNDLWQNVLTVISNNPELNPLRSYVLETSHKTVTKHVMIDKIIETLCQDGSIKFDTTLRSMCCTFRLLLVRKFSIVSPNPRPGAEARFEM